MKHRGRFFRGLTVAALVSALLAPPFHAQSIEQRYNDYPTSARADYVFGCMASNGQSRQSLDQCSCSIDVVASILPYEKYVQAETVLSLRLTGGGRMAIFRTSAMTNAIVAELRRAQAEAEILCF